MRGRMLSAYMTVEATLLMPFVLGAILLVIQIWFFEYDSCLQFQDVSAVVMRTSQIPGLTGEERKERLLEEIASIYSDKYIVWNLCSRDAECTSGYVFLKQRGSLSLLGGDFLFRIERDELSVTTSRRARVLNPVLILRTSRKIG